LRQAQLYERADVEIGKLGTDSDTFGTSALYRLLGSHEFSSPVAPER
jgi:hypothetical protein